VLTTRSRLLAARGHRKASLEAARTALRLAESERIAAGLRFAHAALGFGELGLDRTGAAITALETVERLVKDTGMEEPTIVPWAPDLIEAYARQGRYGDARRVLADLERQAASTGSPVAGAAAARGRGMVDDDFEPAFARALALDDRRPMPYERARTLLAFGRRLHRSRRVAEAVRRGASNRAIAADLFLSPKTVEFHLHQIYRKLGIHSRTQLIAALADRPEAHTDRPEAHRDRPEAATVTGRGDRRAPA
jgi:DNA-binding CsgD family transcriptional regulator